MTVRVDGIELAWREWGTGEAIVALHPGPGADGALFGAWLEPLARTHRVLALDLPDHGGSGDSPPGARSLAGYARAVAGFADALDLRPYTLLGHSFGSFVALACAVDQPGHAARVVSSCGGPDEAIFDGFEERLSAFGRPEVTAAFEAEEEAGSEAELRTAWAGQMPFFCAEPDGAACRALIAQLDAVRFRVDVAHDGDAFGPFDVRTALGSVTVPVLAIGGAVDRATPPEGAAAVAANAADGRLAIVDDAGHFPYAEQPAAWTAAVRSFLGA